MNMPNANMGPSYVSPASNVSPYASNMGPYASNMGPYASNMGPYASNISPLASNVSPLASNVSPLASNIGPHAHANAAPVAKKPFVAGAYTSAGVILVLYILLVIITRKF